MNAGFLSKELRSYEGGFFMSKYTKTVTIFGRLRTNRRKQLHIFPATHLPAHSSNKSSGDHNTRLLRV